MSAKNLRFGLLASVLACVALVLAQPQLALARPGSAGPKIGSLVGVVSFDDGLPGGGVTVQLFRPGSIDFDYFAQTTTGSDGSYRFRRLPADDYSVLATFLTPEFACVGNTSATVAAGETTSANVTLKCN